MVQHLSESEAQKIISERKDAFFSVMQEENGTKILRVYLPENNPGVILAPNWWKQAKPAWWNLWNTGAAPNWWIEAVELTGWRPTQMIAVADESTVKLLKKEGSHYGTELLKKEGVHYGTGYARRGSRDAWPFGSLLPYFVAPMGLIIILRRFRNGQPLDRENRYDRTLLALRNDPGAGIFFGIAFATTFLVVFIANAFTTTNALTTMGLYVVLFLGSIKGAFFGLIAGVTLLYIRTQRTASKAATTT